MLGALILVLAVVPAGAVDVANVAQLVTAVNTANDTGGNTDIYLADGTYTLSDTLYVNAPGVSILGKSQDRNKVIIQGDAMSAGATVGNLIRVARSNFTLRHVTLQRAGFHLVQIVGNENADGATLTDCRLRDSYEQLVKVTYSAATPNVTGDNGRIENCIFEYTAGIGPQYYIGGIDAHAAKNWIVRGNTFRDIASPSGSVAEFAIHFWNTSGSNLVERNIIIDCDRGIGFGLQGQGNSGGIIRNNMIVHSNNGDPFADVGISVEESPGTLVYNNSIFYENDYPNAIEYRFASTTGVQIANNLANRAIQQRDGASATVTNNVLSATANRFRDAAAGDLHLVGSWSGVSDSGVAIRGLTDDIDGQTRPQGAGIDIGADEFATQSVAPNPPTALRVL